MHALSTAPIPAPIATVQTFSIPVADVTEFSALPEIRRREVTVTLKLIERVEALLSTTSLHQACLVVAAASQHLMRGCSAGALRRKYEAYKAGGWRDLVKGYRGPSARHPEAFVRHLQALVEDNQRSMAAAFELIRELWRKGHPIPGYGTWAEYYMTIHPERPLPKHCPTTFYPAGWASRTLYRRAPNKGARVLYQRGFAAAKKYFPSVTRDPSGLRPLEMIVIDDFELDCLCVFPGDRKNKSQIGRVAGLLAMDVGTRRKLHWGLGQRLERTETQADGTVKTVRTGISRVDVQNLLYALFGKYGLPEYTVTIICENAAASISAELELSLAALFDGRVRVERTGLVNHRTLANGFLERGGRPWDKGWIESTFNALWNRLGNLPGYKGNNARLNAPADLEAKIAYTKLLIGQGEKALNLPPEQIALLRLPFPSIQALEQAFAWACAQLDTKTDHQYIGFDRVTEFLLAEDTDPVPFSSLALLTQEQQLQVRPIERMESALERWARLSQGVTFRPIPQAVLALLLLTPKRCVYRNHAVYFEHAKAGYTYIDRDGAILANVPEGTELLGYFDVANPGELHLADLRGSYMGTLPRLGGKRGMVDIRDKDAISAAGADTARLVNRELAAIRERHADQEAQLVADRAHNQAIVDAHKATLPARSKVEVLAEAIGERAAQQIAARDQSEALSRADELDATKLL